jgi:hypothetical protein
MKRKSSLSISAILFLLVVGLTSASYAETLSGRVYEGEYLTEPPTSQGLSDVTVRLYGSYSSGVPGDELDSHTTGSDGWFGLETEEGYEFYTIICEGKSGYTFQDSSSVGGSASGEEIEYELPLTGKTLTGNKFWYKSEEQPPEQPPENQPPVAQNDSASTSQDTPITISVLSNDSDPDNDPLTIINVTDPPNGSVTHNGTTVTYIPDAGFTGSDSFNYTISDGKDGTDTATVTVTVVSGEEPPEGTGTIRGMKYNDLNGNGQKDPGEPGLPGWQIFIDLNDNNRFDEGEHQTTTDSNGNYSFTDLEADAYRIHEVNKTGWRQTDPTVDGVPGYWLVGLEEDQEITEIDFGNQRTDEPSPDIRTDVIDVCLDVEIDIPGIGLIRTNLTGPLTIQTQVGPNGEASDMTANGLDEAVAEITGMNLSGMNPLVGQVRMSLSTNMASTGQIEEQANNTPGILDVPPFTAAGTASSVFNIFFDIELPDLGLLYCNCKPMITQSVVNYWPPAGWSVYSVANLPIELYRRTASTYPCQISPLPPVDATVLNVQDCQQAPPGDDGGGSVVVIKEATPADDTPFLFCAVFRSGNFFNTLCENLNDPSNNTWNITDPNLLQKVSETVPAGWKLTSITMLNDKDGGSSIDFANATVNVDCDEGENITIIFRNDKIEEGQYDYGDAPDLYGTLHANGGAYHDINPNLHLGASIDAESDGQPDLHALGDDNNGDDEDGLTNISSLVPGQPATATIQIINNDAVSLDITVAGWLDFGGDGKWDLVPDHIGTHSMIVPAFSTTPFQFTFTVPTGAIPGPTFVRFRLFRVELEPGVHYLPLPTGYGEEGEVEDYEVTIEAEVSPDDRDYGDAPYDGINYFYPSANHQVGGPWWGDLSCLPDIEPGMQRDNTATGDDADAFGDDENGLFGANLVQGQSGGLFVSFVTGGSGDVTLAGWIDFNGDGDWDDAGEASGPWAMALGPAPAGGYIIGYIILPFTVPAHAHLGQTFARLRIEEGLLGSISHTGPAGAGEVEDHLVEVKVSGPPVPSSGIIWGIKFNDLNGNSSWEIGTEPVLPNWTIWLDSNHNGVYDGGDATTQTDGWGLFMFTGLTAGTYLVGEEQQAGWIQTFPVFPVTHTVTVQLNTLPWGVLFGNQQTGPGVPGEEEVPHIKWSQPPIEIDPNVDIPPVFCGWDEPARSTKQTGQIRQWRMDADDFRCLGPIPITRIRWWGGYKAWTLPELPESQPEAWHIGFWANQVEGLEPDQLYLERLVWSVEIPNERVHREPVGLTEFPQQLTEMCFTYEVQLEPQEWFHQAEFESNDDVFWISITAIYPADAQQVNQWGWMTRPHIWGNGAVMPSIIGEWPTFDERLFPGRIYPIENSLLCGQNQAYDLCFELLTEQPWVKWDLPFTNLREWPHYEDHESYAIEDPNGELLIGQRVSDDWLCERQNPVIAAAWNGSYMGYGYEACTCENSTKPISPDYFILTLWTNAPADADIPNEHPGPKVWEYEATEFDEVLVGFDKHPQGEPNEAVFRYMVRLPEDAWFQQEAPDQIYWFSIIAVYKGTAADTIIYPWAWTNHRYAFGSTAMGLDFTDQGTQTNFLYDQTSERIDMSFTLYTLP